MMVIIKNSSAEEFFLNCRAFSELFNELLFIISLFSDILNSERNRRTNDINVRLLYTNVLYSVLE